MPSTGRGAHLCLPRHGEIPDVSLTPRSKFRLLSNTEAEFRIPGPHRRKGHHFEGTAGRKPNAWSPEPQTYPISRVEPVLADSISIISDAPKLRRQNGHRSS